MNDLPRTTLKRIISEYGRSLCEDPQRCEAFLRDFCGEYRKEINVLISALKEQVPKDLITSQNSVPLDLSLAKLTKRLEDRWAIGQDSARWAVVSWGLALGVISESNLGDGQGKIVKDEVELELELDLRSATARRIKIEAANKKIQNAWITGCISGMLTLFFAIFFKTPEVFIDVLLTFGLAFGIYRKNRVCAVIMFIYFLLSKLLLIESLKGNPIGVMVAIIFIVFYFQGIQGTFQYHEAKSIASKN